MENLPVLNKEEKKLDQIKDEILKTAVEGDAFNFIKKSIDYYVENTHIFGVDKLDLKKVFDLELQGIDNFRKYLELNENAILPTDFFSLHMGGKEFSVETKDHYNSFKAKNECPGLVNITYHKEMEIPGDLLQENYSKGKAEAISMHYIDNSGKFYGLDLYKKKLYDSSKKEIVASLVTKNILE